MNSLAQTMQIIWNQLPSDWRKAALCVIADGHKKQAEDLIAHGSGSSNNAAVQLEYCKYLVLHPHKEASEYVSVYKPLRIIHILSRTEEKDMCTVHQLEEENGGRVGVGPALVRMILPSSSALAQSKFSRIFRIIYRTGIICWPFFLESLDAFWFSGSSSSARERG
jgi:hypothetical protein